MVDIKMKKRMRNMLLIVAIILFAILVRIGFIQFVQGADLSKRCI